jgi:hypothetical protein
MPLTMDNSCSVALQSTEFCHDCDTGYPDEDLNGNIQDVKSEETDSVAGLSSHSNSADPMSMDDSDDPNSINDELNSSSYHLNVNDDLGPINKDELMEGSFHDCEMSRTYTVPTPIDRNLTEVVDPLREFTQVNIMEKKYYVLPSITKKSSTPYSTRSENSVDNESLEKSLMRELTKNQMDFSREKMEKEADFFADHRINTSTVKVTPRVNPLPPIQKTNDRSPNET